jgi:putative addiction module component (TIGR02574 family)
VVEQVSKRTGYKMSQSQLLSEILVLPIAQRLDLVEQIWDSIYEVQERFELTDAQKAELDRRLAERAASPGRGVPWPELKARLLGE